MGRQDGGDRAATPEVATIRAATDTSTAGNPPSDETVLMVDWIRTVGRGRVAVEYGDGEQDRQPKPGPPEWTT